jgi:hypothetical protein
MIGSTSFAGVALLTLVAPFELTAPLLRLPRQSVSNLEAAVMCAFVCGGAAIVWSRQLPDWRTPLTLPWIALLAAMLVAAVVSPVSRVNALHMTGRLTAAFGVYLLAVNGITTSARLRSALSLAVAAGVVVSLLAILEYRGVRPVLTALTAFRPAVSTVGAQLRAGGPLQYPTIASMYLEVVFAFGLGLMLAALDAGRHARVAGFFIALVLIAEAITLTFTRAGLITMTASLLLVGARHRLQLHSRSGTAIVAALAVVIGLLLAGSRSASSLWLRLTSEGQESWYRASIVAPPEIELHTGRLSDVPIAVTNTGRLPWDSQAVPPMLLSYHWLEASGDRIVTFEGQRTPFAEPVARDRHRRSVRRTGHLPLAAACDRAARAPAIVACRVADVRGAPDCRRRTGQLPPVLRPLPRSCQHRSTDAQQQHVRRDAGRRRAARRRRLRLAGVASGVLRVRARRGLA